MKLKLIVYSLFLCFVFVLCSPKAGIYIDNGNDQTALDREMSLAERREMELEILNLLGLPNRPRRTSNVPLRKSAPRFLMDIYTSLMDNENSRQKRSTDLNLSGEEQNAIDESDVIMTFDSVGHHVSGVRHERGKRLWFNVSEVPVAENIVGAELRIFQNAVNKPTDAKYVLTAYQLISTEDGERELQFISAVNTTAGYSGWLGLNLTDSFATWVAFPDSNKGLYLSVHPVDKPGHEIRPEDIGLVTIKGEDEVQPFMVAFLKAVNHVNSRVTREAPRENRKSDYRSVLKIPGESRESDVISCKIHTLYISFHDLEWNDWIIAPKGYAAYYCKGECNFPLNAHMNATNHAIVQTLVHLMNPLRYPKPCCAPTKLTPISVLYYADDGNVVLKKYKKMVVKSCGCH